MKMFVLEECRSAPMKSSLWGNCRAAALYDLTPVKSSTCWTPNAQSLAGFKPASLARGREPALRTMPAAIPTTDGPAGESPKSSIVAPVPTISPTKPFGPRHRDAGKIG
jgi:hypothetical protein